MNRFTFALLTTSIFMTGSVIKYGLAITFSAPLLVLFVLTGAAVYALDDLNYAKVSK